jgi:glycosyltransferase involved in cell wall biosynthesis
MPSETVFTGQSSRVSSGKERSDAIDSMPPAVSVVIPTRGRPQLVARAVASALAQSLRNLEVIVVVDGPDPETEDELARIADPRLHLLCLARNVGGSEARNTGVRYARGKWIAFLDDDDEWFPEKLLAQTEAAEAADADDVIVACRFIERTERAERVLPRRLPDAGEPFSEYMFARRGWNSGEGFLQTSTWLVSRRLLLDVPFTVGLKRCQDLDWLLRAAAEGGTQIIVLPVTLAIFHHEEGRERVSRSPDWKFLHEWAVSNRGCFTPRAFAFFIATFCAPSAAKQGEGLRTLIFLLRCCSIHGLPNPKCVALLFVCWFMPETRRRSLRAWLHRLRAVAAEERRVTAPHALPGRAR